MQLRTSRLKIVIFDAWGYGVYSNSSLKFNGTLTLRFIPLHAIPTTWLPRGNFEKIRGKKGAFSKEKSGKKGQKKRGYHIFRQTLSIYFYFFPFHISIAFFNQIFFLPYLLLDKRRGVQENTNLGSGELLRAQS